MFIEIRGCRRNWLKLSQSLELLILLKTLRGDLPQFLWGQEIGVFLKNDKRIKSSSDCESFSQFRPHPRISIDIGDRF